MPKGRLVVTYSDGSWTDNLSIARYGLRDTPEGLSLHIDVESRVRPGKIVAARKALAEFVGKCQRIHTIQIAKPRFNERLKSVVGLHDSRRLGLRLRANGMEVLYPAGVIFGPDEVTLNLG